jgi:hypothetical protein
VGSLSCSVSVFLLQEVPVQNIKIKNVNNDRATGVADLCCLKLNLNLGLSWFSVLVLRKSGGTKRGS